MQAVRLTWAGAGAGHDGHRHASTPHPGRRLARVVAVDSRLCSASEQNLRCSSAARPRRCKAWAGVHIRIPVQRAAPPLAASSQARLSTALCDASQAPSDRPFTIICNMPLQPGTTSRAVGLANTGPKVLDASTPPADAVNVSLAVLDRNACPEVPRQSNFVDCGICALFNMRAIAVQAMYGGMASVSQIELPVEPARHSSRANARKEIVRGLWQPAVVDAAVRVIAASCV